MNGNLTATTSIKPPSASKRQRFSCGITILGLLVSIGCGSGEPGTPSLGSVKGKVTINGEPKEGLVVTFQPQGKTGALSQGSTNAQGEYELIYTGNTSGAKGAAIGEHLVRINSIATDAPNEKGEIVAQVFIPEEYNTSSTLKETVATGDNPPKNFDLKIQKKK